ncbi:MAG: AraC family transcriptional regulator [Synergistetes bacterium]|nr:AraC family transcriptional regulator [Synergistota bacterium]MCX8128244.1 AraC family transcriptional regulator [Synergistota bacterium]MDW8192691.1 AraC family transcriptional regulator [Synergistota bacterium]
MSLKEKVAYIKGFIKGGGVNEKNFAEVIELIVDALDEMAFTVEELEKNQLDLEEYVESIDDDLANLEREVLGKEETLEEEFEELECSNCGEMFFVPAEELYSEEEVRCPVCGKVVIFREGEESGNGKQTP